MPQTSDLQQDQRSRGNLETPIPSLDARKLATGDAATVTSLRDACQQTGFFFLDRSFDHNGAVQRVLGQMKNFFDLPPDDPRKQAVNVEKTQAKRGWTPIYRELPYQPGTIAHVESFDCGRSQPGESGAANRWPDLPGFRQDVRSCWEVLADAGLAVLTGLALAAGLKRDPFTCRCDSQELSTLRLMHYPQNDAPDTDGNVGISAHTDFECITLIMQTAPGLELLAVDGSWYDVPLHDGRLVVMLDDMLERWTNGQFRATGHRVRNTRHCRHSIVMFCAVNDDEIVAPLPAFVSHETPDLYLPVTQREHLAGELAKAAQNLQRGEPAKSPAPKRFSK